MVSSLWNNNDSLLPNTNITEMAITMDALSSAVIATVAEQNSNTWISDGVFIGQWSNY